MEELIKIGTGVAAAVLIAVQVFKFSFPNLMDSRLYPFLAIGMGVIFSLGTYVVPELRYDEVSIPGLALAGVIAGLVASGFFDLTKIFKEK